MPKVAELQSQIDALQAQIDRIQARPAEPEFKDGEKPPVILWRFVTDDQTFTGAAIRAGDLWYVATTDPGYDPPPLTWDDLLDWAESVQLSDVTFPSW